MGLVWIIQTCGSSVGFPSAILRSYITYIQKSVAHSQNTWPLLVVREIKRLYHRALFNVHF